MRGCSSSSVADSNRFDEQQPKCAGVSGPSAAAASSSAAASQPVHLYPDALFSILKFTTLKEQLIFSRVSRSWRQAAILAPALKAWRASSALRLSDLDDVSRLLHQHNIVQHAEASMPSIVAKLVSTLRQAGCATVSQPLVAALRSAKLLRKTTRIDSDGRKGDVTLTLQLLLPAQSNAAASPSASSELYTTPLRLSWRLNPSADADTVTEHDWSIFASAADEQLLPKCVLNLHERSWSEDGTVTCSATPLAKWLRARAILSGSRRQQGVLLHCFVASIFKFVKAPMNEWADEVLRNRCAQLFKEEFAEPFPLSETEGEESEDGDEENAE